MPEPIRLAQPGEKSEPLMKVAARRVGLIRAGKVMSFMFAWDVVRRDLGREPTVEEYADWWRQPMRTAYREQSYFRECFPGEETPGRLLDLLAEARAAGGSVAALPVVA